MPCDIVTKVITLQDSWSLNLSWDETLPEPINWRFRLWINQLHLLSFDQIPRWLGLEQSKHQKVVLRVFCYASAHAPSAFLQGEKGKDYSTLVQVKTRVTPVKGMTIPLLELMACLIGGRLANFVKGSIKIENLDVILWTDSTNALAWICRHGQWSVFVRNSQRNQKVD